MGQYEQLTDARRALDDAQLLALFKSMVRARAFDEGALRLQRTGRLVAYYQSSGMEAAAGAAFALRERDWIFGAYRDQPIRLARGVSIAEELAVWRGALDDAWNPNRVRITPMNVTIGTHIPHAVGFAYGARLQGRDEIAMAVFGDGATSEGDFHAGLNFAGVWQAPVVFFCQNNQYAQSTPVAKQTASETLAQKAEAYGFGGVRIDGMDPLAVLGAVRDAVEQAAAGGGPTLIEAVMYRYGAHSTYDGEPVYRTRDEVREWRERDPLDRIRRLLGDRGALPEDLEASIRSDVDTQLEAAIERFDAAEPPARESIFRHTYAVTPPHLIQQRHRGEGSIAEPVRDPDPSVGATASDPVIDGECGQMTLVEALNRALDSAMRDSDRVVILGEDVGLEGGVFRVTAGLQSRYGEARVIDTPLCESGIVGTAVGMAIAGIRPVCELEFAGFMNPAFDQIIFHVARYRWRTRGAIATPLVIRMPCGGGHEGMEGHSDSPETYFLHTPGLTVVYPSNAYDAKGLITSALRGEDPVIFFEPIARYFTKSDDIPVHDYAIPIGKARITREGTDLTIVTYGNAVHVALEVADRLEGEHVSAEVVDLRTLKPWDKKAVLASVEKTGRVVICHEAPAMGGVGAEIAATIAEEGGYLLETPLVRVGHPDAVWAPSKLERYSRLSPEVVLEAVNRVLPA